jgi:hypothetical protein
MAPGSIPHASASAQPLQRSHRAFLVWSSVLILAGVLWFFTPRFALWAGLDVPMAHFNPEVNRAVWALRQIEDPFIEIPGTTNAPLRWRLAFPLLAHHLHFPPLVFLALPHLGALLVIGLITGLTLREGGGRAAAAATAALMGTTSWFFASTGWLAYFDSWYVLGILVLTFGRSPVSRVLACLLTPWVDERFLLSLPLCLTVRAVHRGQLGSGGAGGPWRDWALCGAAVLPYLVARAAAGDESGLSAYLANRLSKDHDPWRCLAGVWAGLRVAWVFVAAYLYVAVRTARGIWKPVVLLVVPATAVGMLVLAGDYSRSMSMLLPAALLGVWLSFADGDASGAPATSGAPRPRHGPALLAGALALNLLLPAQHVVGAFVSPIYYVHHEIERYRNPPPYLTGEAQLRQGQQQESAGDLAGAIASYDAAIALSPRGWAVYAQRGIARSKRNEWQAALADYRRALDLAPADWPHRAEVEKLAAQAEGRGGGGGGPPPRTDWETTGDGSLTKPWIPSAPEP